MAKIVTFGEIMLRLSTINCERFSQAKSFDLCFGGGEANVAVSLAHYGHDAYFISKLPDNDIGKAALKSLKSEDVRCNYVVKGGNRIGIYYLEVGSSLRGSKVIYDRSRSAISESNFEEYNFEEALNGAEVFHFTGITPALSENCALLIKKACIVAKKLGVTVSCDLNYRKKLWTKEKARQVMIPLVEYVDICIGNEEDFEACLGYKPDSDIIKGKTDAAGYKNIFKTLYKDFNFKYVASTLRESYSSSHNGWKGLLFDGQTFYESKHYDIEPIVDRVGSGDSFAAGLIHGLLTQNDKQKALEFAIAASALKHTIPGDFNQVSEEEVWNLVNGDSSGRVSR
jgi:2-dehydro-3-deoxygluconokinase